MLDSVAGKNAREKTQTRQPLQLEGYQEYEKWDATSGAVGTVSKHDYLSDLRNAGARSVVELEGDVVCAGWLT